MAEFEGKHELDVCGTCRYYYVADRATSGTTGWCKRRPRLYQHHDERTHRTNWCSYYEVDQVAKTRAEEIMESMEREAHTEKLLARERGTDVVDSDAAPEQLTNGEQTRAMYEDTEETPPSNTEPKTDPVVVELTMMLEGMKNMHKAVAQDMMQVAAGDNVMHLMEMKGMAKAVNLMLLTIEGRLQHLATNGTSN